MVGNAVVVNFSGGETSPRSRGRFDQPWYQTSARKMLNFIAELQGPARFRPGFVFGFQTRQGAAARVFDFEVSNVLAYLLEFTPLFLRVRNPVTQQLLTTTQAVIAGITQAATAVVTVVSATGLSNGKEVVLSNVTGMPQLNNKQFLISGLAGSTFNLTDPVTGVVLNTAAYPAAATGGIAAVVYELATPYTALDLTTLQFASTRSTAYLTTATTAPQKMTVDSNGTFAIGTYSRTNDPFVAGAALTINGVTLGKRTRVSFIAGFVILPNVLYAIAAIVGTTQLNGNSYDLVSQTSWNYVTFLDLASQLPGLANGDTIVFGTVPGVLGSQLSGGTFFVGNVFTGLGLTSFRLYYDAGLTEPVEYLADPAGNFAVYPPGNCASITAGGGIGDTFSVNTSAFPFSISASSPTAVIQSSVGVDVDSRAFTAYASGGTATPAAEYPIAITFYEGRLVFAGTNQRPDCFFGSRAPDDNGNSRYDDFTGGTDADFAVFFQLAPTGGDTPYILWARGGPDYLFIGTFGGPFRASGSGLDIPITPSSINVRQFDTAGAAAAVPAGLQQMFFIQRGGATVRAIKVINPYLATFESSDLCLNAEQVGYSALQRVVLQRGRPDTLWAVRADGQLVGMSVHLTVQNADTLTGWHRHQLGGVGAKVLDVAAVARNGGYDQLWVVVQRTVNGATRCYVEVLADDVVFPDPEDFFQGSGPVVRRSDNPSIVNTSAADGSKAADKALWGNAVWRAQASYVHLDAELSYDGSLRGTLAAATLTPSAVGVVQVEGQAATTITLTASMPVFAASDVGSEVWAKPNAVTGLGGGRALITAFIDPQHATATVSVPFASTAAVAAGDWYFATSVFYGFGHLEGSTVAVVADGAVASDGGQTGDADFPTITVTQGTITLPPGNLGIQQRAAVLRAGLPYVGILETHNLEMGGRSGPAQAKARNVDEINIRFMNTLGCEYGTDLYSMQKIEHRLSDAVADRPAPVFSGIKRLQLEDSWSGLDDLTREKNVFVTQRLPLPAVVQFLDLTYSASDEGTGGGAE